MEVKCLWTKDTFIATIDDMPQMVINKKMETFKSHFADGIYYIEIVSAGGITTYHYKSKMVWEYILGKIMTWIKVYTWPELNLGDIELITTTTNRAQVFRSTVDPFEEDQ